MKFIKFLALLSVFIFQSNSIYGVHLDKQRKVEANNKRSDETGVVYRSMIREICELLGKQKINGVFKFDGIFKEHELGKVIHIIIAKVDYVYTENLANKKHFLQAVCYTLNKNYGDFFRLYKEKKFVAEFTHTYRHDNSFFEQIIYDAMIPECLKKIAIVIKHKREYNREVLEAHNTLKRHYLNPIRLLLENGNDEVLEFLAFHADDELLENVKEYIPKDLLEGMPGYQK